MSSAAPQTTGFLSPSGSNAETYDSLAHLNQQATTGTLNDPRGTPVLTSPTGSPINAMGEVTAHDPSTNTDTLTWDDLGRLIKVARRDSSNNGLNFSIKQDAHQYVRACFQNQKD